MIYFDNAATSKPYVEAVEAFVDVNKNNFGNPISNHGYGRKAERILEKSRESMLNLLSLSSSFNLLFTSGASESNNIAIKGIAKKYKNRGNKIISSIAEHSSVINTLEKLKEEGFEVIYLPINALGYVDPKDLEKAIDDKTILVSIMSSNNEIGSISPLDEYSKIIKKYPKCFFHSDITQSLGKIKMDYGCCDLLSFSSHKFGGVKGTGGLVFKKNISFEPIENGGEQEYGFRPGTVNVAGIKAMEVALKKSLSNLDDNLSKISKLNLLLRGFLENNPQFAVNSPLNSNPYIFSFSTLKKKASVVVEALSNKEIYVSSVSACNSKKEPFSYVVYALTNNKEISANTIRVSFSPESSEEEVNEFVNALKQIIVEVKDR